MSPQLARMMLPFKAVRLETLSRDRCPLKVASGFICDQGDGLYLYTCWHVVTGLDPNNLRFRDPPAPAFLRVIMKDARVQQPGVLSIGAKQIFELDLYDDNVHPPTPKWIQDSADVPNTDLNAINVHVPLLHDLAKLRLPTDVRTSEFQVVRRSEFPKRPPLVGERLYLVGFPHGYSVTGSTDPTPIVLTRFVASREIGGQGTTFLVDGAGAQGMSGGPVFFEHDDSVSLAGIYTGTVFPDQAVKRKDDAVTPPERSSALGTCCALWVWFTPAFQEELVKGRRVRTTTSDAAATTVIQPGALATFSAAADPPDPGKID